ncbi:MAG TPA: PQQ-dependent dehydrogenase, methanol/ethanol family [Longimicrobium sp.]|jgi:PQQ-dependent dehydrogenase (methanol/ethanol family)
MILPSRAFRATAVACLLLGGCKSREPQEDPKFPREMLKSTAVPFATPTERTHETTRARPAAAAFRPEDGQWVMSLKDYAGTRYSGLDQINTGTVRGLKLAWHFDLKLARGQEATPLVVDNTMYVVTSFPNLLYAFDLTRPGPAVKWVYDPKPARAAQGVACCDHVNRGAAYAAGRLFYATLDNYAVAVDAATGREIWRTRLGSIHAGETMTMAPLVVRDKVIFGNAGAEFGVRGWVRALDVATGRVVWTAWATGPDRDVLIGPRFRPFYAKDRGRDLGVTTWPAEHWKIGGGTMWGWLNYDPELDLLYYGTANAAPWNPEQRPGDNKWTATLFARRPDTGEAVWAYQWDPHNVFDWDGVNESLLLDMPVEGRMRRVMVRAERNGFVYVIDRATGEVLSATPYMHSTVVKGVDTRSGMPVEDLTMKPGYGKTAHGICPAVPGAKDWEPTAFSPRTGLVYIPANNLCMDVEGMEANYIAGTPYMGVSVKMYPGPGGHRGEMIGWDPVNRRRAWTIIEKFVLWSGPLATAGDLVFYGTMDRWLKAVDARTGQVLWRFQTATGIIAPPISYRGPDGKQYVAVLSGPGGWPGSVVSVPLDPRDETADKGFAGAMHDLPEYTGRGGHLYVFALP